MLNKVTLFKLSLINPSFKYTGLPENPNTEEFKSVWQRSGHLKLHAITLLSALINTHNEALALHERMKFSAFERDLAMFIVEQRAPKPSPKPLLPYQQLLVGSKSKTNDVREWILEVMKYNNFAFREEFANWPIPKFPINGIMLKEAGVDPGRTMGNVMSELKRMWAENEFESSSEDLMKEVPELCSRFAAKRKK